MLLVSLLLKAAIDGEFLLSSDHPFQIRLTEGRNELIVDPYSEEDGKVCCACVKI